MANEKPYFRAAFICEKILHEKDQVLSAVRIVDNFQLSVPAQLPAGATAGFAAFPLTVFLSWFSRGPADWNVKHLVDLKLHHPDGLPPKANIPQASFIFSEANQTANLIYNLTIQFNSKFGDYHFDVLLDGEEVTRIPFKLIQQNPQAALPN